VGVIHLVTPEFPPKIGGVAAYTRQLAQGLSRAGEQVHVWCPEEGTGDGFTVHPLFGRFAVDDLQRVGRALDEFPGPRRVIVQWVPHGYSRRAMNVGFCLWLWRRAARGDCVEIMVHEPYLSFREGNWRQAGAAIVHRVMTVILLRAATRVWTSVPLWERMWKPYTLGRHIPFDWLPIPSPLGIPDQNEVAGIRRAVAPDGGPIVGHLGTYGRPVAALLQRAVPELLRRSRDVRVLLMGVGSDRFRAVLVERDPASAARVIATGPKSDAALAAHVAACDLLLQPYPDGISSRRTSAMSGLHLGVPVVTTRGHVTEPLWEQSLAIRLVPVNDTNGLVTQTVELLADSDGRGRLGRFGRDLYDRMFDLNHTVAALTGSTTGKAA